jgi:hypothetical protein
MSEQEEASTGYVVLEGEEAARWVGLIAERFGIAPEGFADWVLVQSNRKLISLAHADCAPPAWPPPLAVGLPFIHINMAFPKLTTGAARLLGPLATQNVIALDASQADWYLRRINQAVAFEQMEGCTKGYVIVRHEAVMLGVGLIRPQEDGSGWLESLYPKAHALAAHRSAFGQAG